MRNQNLEHEGKNRADGHQTSSQQPEMNYDSSIGPGHSNSGPFLAIAARSVRFAETSLLQVVTRHEDREDVDLQDLWYSQADLKLMRLDALREKLMVRWNDVGLLEWRK